MFRVAGLIALCSLRLLALPALTTIQDTLYTADGSPMNGTVIITWPSFVASDGTKIAAQTLTVPVTSGYFQVALVPTVGASKAVSYSVRVNSAGKNQSSELWSVPPSATPLTIASVMVGQTGGIIIGSNPVVTVPQSSTIQITDVTGLSNELAIRPMIGPAFANSRAAVIDATGAIDGAAGNASDCLHVDGTSASCGGGSSNIFVDSEVPSGAMNGANPSFTLANTPVPPTSVSIWRNGLFEHYGVDYSVAGSAITFLGTPPQYGDVLVASYRTGTLSGVTFVDGETPGGTPNGANSTFTLANSPNPAASLALYRNGLRLEASIDYTLNGATITFLSAALPQSGDTLLCSYRH